MPQHPSHELLGRHVRQRFVGYGMFEGTVTGVVVGAPGEESKLTVEYEDGDVRQLSEKTVRKWLLPCNTDQTVSTVDFATTEEDEAVPSVGVDVECLNDHGPSQLDEGISDQQHMSSSQTSPSPLSPELNSAASGANTEPTNSDMVVLPILAMGSRATSGEIRLDMHNTVGGTTSEDEDQDPSDRSDEGVCEQLVENDGMQSDASSETFDVGEEASDSSQRPWMSSETATTSDANGILVQETQDPLVCETPETQEMQEETVEEERIEVSFSSVDATPQELCEAEPTSQEDAQSSQSEMSQEVTFAHEITSALNSSEEEQSQMGSQPLQTNEDRPTMYVQTQNVEETDTQSPRQPPQAEHQTGVDLEPLQEVHRAEQVESLQHSVSDEFESAVAALVERVRSSAQAHGEPIEQRVQTFRSELLHQLRTGQWESTSIPAAPAELRPMFQRVQSAFEQRHNPVLSPDMQPRPQQPSGNGSDSLSIPSSHSVQFSESSRRGSLAAIATGSTPPFSFRITPTLATTGTVGCQQTVWRPRALPPSLSVLQKACQGPTPVCAEVIHQEAYFSDPRDRRRFEFGGVVYNPPSRDAASLHEVDSTLAHQPQRSAATAQPHHAKVLMPCRRPPSVAEAQRSLRRVERREQRTRQARGGGAAGFSTVDNAGREVFAPSVNSAVRASDSQSSSVVAPDTPAGGRARQLTPQDKAVQAESPAVSSAGAGTEESDSVVVCSPRYDEGMGFAEMGGASATLSNTLRRFSTGGLSSRTAAVSGSVPPSSAGPSPPLGSSSSGGGGGGSMGPPSMQTAPSQQAVLHGTQHLVLYSLELHVQTRAQLLPDPLHDPVTAICYVVHNESRQQVLQQAYAHEAGAIVLTEPCDTTATGADDGGGAGSMQWEREFPAWAVEAASSESELLHCFVASVRQHDPDFILGYETENGSLGYLVQRAKHLQQSGELTPPIPDLELVLGRLSAAAIDDALVRAAKLSGGGGGGGAAGGGGGGGGMSEQAARATEYTLHHGSGQRLVGRHCLNVWRILRGEVKLHAYTQEATALHMLGRHLPRVPCHELTAWWGHSLGGGGGGGGGAHYFPLRRRVLVHSMIRARLNLQLLDQLDLVGRTSGMARVFGIDFNSVLVRGSQFRVESMMLRLCHRHSPPFLASSPSRQQVASQRALEVIPLVMEPFSRLYVDPVLVLDFRSLYPSVIIAYNLCYSTCLGKLLKPGQGDATTPRRFGAFDNFVLPPGLLAALTGATSAGGSGGGAEAEAEAEAEADAAGDGGGGGGPSGERTGADSLLTLSPNEVMFAKPAVRAGILPRLLTEILEARIQVKRELKEAERQGDVTLRRMLNAKQFALKLVANVTYGYTSASFSGRMPCVELADAIVAYGPPGVSIRCGLC
jgi:DNA polymerase elongation subunit (family B)